MERQKATSSKGSGILLVPVLGRNPYSGLSGSQTQGSLPVGSPPPLACSSGQGWEIPSCSPLAWVRPRSIPALTVPQEPESEKPSSWFLSIEEGNSDLRKQMCRLEEELDQEKKKYAMLEIKLRNSERAREDAERRNQLLQREMEEFFATLGSLTAGTKGARAPE